MQRAMKRRLLRTMQPTRSKAYHVASQTAKGRNELPKSFGVDLNSVEDGPSRLEHIYTRFIERFDREPTVIVSAPGRSEIIGNHTDHNNGRVVAAAINLDTLIVAAPSRDNTSRLVSRGWDETFEVNPAGDRSHDSHDTQRLMRGVIAGLDTSGYGAPAYEAVLDSRVLPGSGLSSSAALEISLVGIHEALSDSEIPPLERARVGRFAENEYVGKPSGLMDQTAVSVGGCVAIDFSDPYKPRYHQIALDFHRSNHQLAIVNTGGSHADLTDQYAAVPQEMHAVAKALGVSHLAETTKKNLLQQLNAVRKHAGDRAVLRAFHFFDEQDRVSALTDAVDSRHTDRVLTLMNDSGESSWMMLQNVYPDNGGADQSLALGLTLTREYFHERGAVGACRVHGGGFAGTILAVVPQDLFTEYRTVMDRVFGEHATQALHIRTHGLIYGTL